MKAHGLWNNQAARNEQTEDYRRMLERMSDLLSVLVSQEDAHSTRLERLEPDYGARLAEFPNICVFNAPFSQVQSGRSQPTTGGTGGAEQSARTSLRSGMSPSTLPVFARGSARRLAQTARVAANEMKANQRSTSTELAPGGCRRGPRPAAGELADEPCSLGTPAASDLESEHGQAGAG